jgi:hypothetical protein
VGLGLGLVGFAGLWVDRQIEEEDGTLAAGIEGEEAKKLPISIRVVDRK